MTVKGGEAIKGEYNPFVDPEIAEQWITSVEGAENEKREVEIYPLLKSWSSTIPSGLVVEIWLADI